MQRSSSDRDGVDNTTSIEQKRRQTLRDKLKMLQELVPALHDASGPMKSEAVTLQKTVEYMNQLIENRAILRRNIQQLNEQLGQPAGLVDSDPDS